MTGTGGVSRRWLLTAVLAAGCAAPTRYLSTRAVDDPIVLPRGLFDLWAKTSASQNTPGSSGEQVFFGFGYGITDRLQLTRFGLRYAILDDAPPPPGARTPALRAPVSLAVDGGLTGFGYSSAEGLILLPSLSIEVAKHVDARLRVWTSASWDAFWTQTPLPSVSPYWESLWPRSRRTSNFELSAGAVVQLEDHVALVASVTEGQAHACVAPTCGWASRAFGVSVGPVVRPWRFLSLSARGFFGDRWRPDVSLDAGAPPDHVFWSGVSGTVSFFW
jgi:hypothetical protein